MSLLKRRHFLQLAGSTLATLGLSQADLLYQGNRYAKVLAQSTPRKLALLVGINDYPESSNFSPLQGCITDVELQRQLLIHRFGFKPADILTVTDAKATRQGILTAFEEHLIKQAKTGDVVVFHYSGHGSQVTDPDRDAADGLNSTFVPVDSVLPADFPDQGGVVKDIMGHTLFLLMSALATENVTVVLDSCHSGGGTRGNLRVRSRSGGAILQAAPAEFEYQNQWLAKLKLSKEEFIQRRKAGVAKGVVIASAKRDQLAADAPFSDFYAGAFTYLMTQYLWQNTGTTVVGSVIPSVARSTTKVSSSNQEPIYEVKPGTANQQQLLYFTPKEAAPAEAVITKVEGKKAEVWLGGLDPQSLAAFERNAVLSTVDASGHSQGQVKLDSRNGLIGRGTLLNAATPGALLQEKVRGIPTQLTLKIGLDPSLGNDLNQAKQAIQSIKRLEAVPLHTGEVQYIFGRMTTTYQQQLPASSDRPPIDSIGLFYPGLDPVPGSFNVAGESATDAVRRLQAKFKALLAARLIKLMLNTNSSRLDVQASVREVGKNGELVASNLTVRGGPPKIALGKSLQINVVNQEARELYVSVLVIDAQGEMAVLFPNQWTASAEVMKLAAGKTLSIPNPATDGFSLVTQEPKGATELLIVASTHPLSGALKALQGVASRSGQTRGPIGLTDPTEIIGTVLSDVDSVTRSSRSGETPSNGVLNIDMTQFSALSITFQVV